jgi:Tfp pilus assembly protein FimT
MKLIIAFALLAIVASLALAGRAMLKAGRNGEAKSNRMVNALALRVGLSVALFVFVLISYKMGWIHPTGVPMGR